MPDGLDIRLTNRIHPKIDFPRCGFNQPIHQPEERRLAASTRPDEDGRASIKQSQVDGMQCDGIAVGFGDAS